MPPNPMLGRGYNAPPKPHPLGTPALRASLGTSIVRPCLLAIDATESCKKRGLCALLHSEQQSPLYSSHFIDNSACVTFTTFFFRANPHQSAYCKHNSTETALLYIHDYLINAIGSQKISCLCLLDISAAFDTIDHNILLSRLGTDRKWLSQFRPKPKPKVNLQSIRRSHRLQLTC